MKFLSSLRRLAAKQLRRVLRSSLITSVTPTGWALLVATIVGALLGWGRGWLEFRALAVSAVVVLLVASVSVLRRRQHSVTLELGRPRVQAGESALGRIEIRAAGGRGTAPTTMELPVGKAVATFRVGHLGPDDEHEELFSIPTRRRGVIPLGPVRSVQVDPVGAISRAKVLTESTELYIHPRLIHLDPGAVGVLKDVEGITTAKLSSSDVSFHALRDYVPGDPRRSVHWKTTAKTGRLMVQQFEETMRAHLLILLSTRSDDYATEDDFELAVSTAASLGVATLRDDRQLTVRTSAGDLNFPNTLGFLDSLSAVELGAQGREMRELAALSTNLSGISVSALVSGDVAPADLRAAQLLLPAGVRTFAVRCASTLDLSRRRVGDLTVLDVPRLDDLPVAVGSLT